MRVISPEKAESRWTLPVLLEEAGNGPSRRSCFLDRTRTLGVCAELRVRPFFISNHVAPQSSVCVRVFWDEALKAVGCELIVADHVRLTDFGWLA